MESEAVQVGLGDVPVLPSLLHRIYPPLNAIEWDSDIASVSDSFVKIFFKRSMQILFWLGELLNLLCEVRRKIGFAVLLPLLSERVEKTYDFTLFFLAKLQHELYKSFYLGLFKRKMHITRLYHEVRWLLWLWQSPDCWTWRHDVTY